jgi:hypothetical protein
MFYFFIFQFLSIKSVGKGNARSKQGIELKKNCMDGQGPDETGVLSFSFYLVEAATPKCWTVALNSRYRDSFWRKVATIPPFALV